MNEMIFQNKKSHLGRNFKNLRTKFGGKKIILKKKKMSKYFKLNKT